MMIFYVTSYRLQNCGSLCMLGHELLAIKNDDILVSCENPKCVQQILLKL